MVFPCVRISVFVWTTKYPTMSNDCSRRKTFTTRQQQIEMECLCRSKERSTSKKYTKPKKIQSGEFRMPTLHGRNRNCTYICIQNFRSRTKRKSISYNGYDLDFFGFKQDFAQPKFNQLERKQKKNCYRGSEDCIFRLTTFADTSFAPEAKQKVFQGFECCCGWLLLANSKCDFVFSIVSFKVEAQRIRGRSTIGRFFDFENSIIRWVDTHTHIATVYNVVTSDWSRQICLLLPLSTQPQLNLLFQKPNQTTKNYSYKRCNWCESRSSCLINNIHSTIICDGNAERFLPLFYLSIFLRFIRLLHLDSQVCAIIQPLYMVQYFQSHLFRLFARCE